MSGENRRLSVVKVPFRALAGLGKEPLPDELCLVLL